MATVQPFRIAVPDETLERIRAKVAGYTWHEMPDDGGWVYGTNLDYMRELCAYWLEEFDWRAQEAALNRFSQFTAPVGAELSHVFAAYRDDTPVIRRQGNMINVTGH